MSDEPIQVQISYKQNEGNSAIHDVTQNYLFQRDEIIELLKEQILKKDEQISRLLISISNLAAKLQV